MLKKCFFALIFLTVAFIANGQNHPFNSSPKNDVISNFKHLSPQQLLDTANYYYDKNSYDTALICYHLLINTSPKNDNFEQQDMLMKVYNKSAIIYASRSDYRMAYDFYIKALHICENYNLIDYATKIYLNIGNIYNRLKHYEAAKYYYFKALDLCNDSTSIVMVLNNLGDVEIAGGHTNSSFYYLDKALQISKQHQSVYLSYVLSTLGAYYQNKKLYDSAFYYLRLSLEYAKKNNEIEVEITNLSDLGNLFLKINKTDSALYYVGLSNKIASENKRTRIFTNNHLILSEIEKSRGRYKNALEYYNTYTKLKESFNNAEIISSINQARHLYEISKTNQQIEQLAIKQQNRERIIKITLVVLLLVSIVLVYIFLQKRKLNSAYTALVEKNLEIADFQNNPSEKYKKSALTQNMQDELLYKILALMEDTSIICDTDFSVDKLAELVQSNRAYVSQVINDALKKNFRAFLNDYRIREAQQRFSEPDVAKYTIDSIALMVGYKSPKTFREAFKEVTGVSPNFYLKSMVLR
ncbi:MAG: AraC family transcriptional regulator [Bacteroidales bacterium]|jgi:AraC-like DNA-binding protein|nr:AraC family transcriptional regulator [Bacteroidales bacterium]